MTPPKFKNGCKNCVYLKSGINDGKYYEAYYHQAFGTWDKSYIMVIRRDQESVEGWPYHQGGNRQYLDTKKSQWSKFWAELLVECFVKGALAKDLFEILNKPIDPETMPGNELFEALNNRAQQHWWWRARKLFKK